MGCVKSKNTQKINYNPFRKRSYSIDLQAYSAMPKFNDNKLSKLKYLSGSLQMEAELLDDLNQRMPRYSTAGHDLSSSDGMDLFEEDGVKYTRFKMDLITYKPLQLKFVDGIPEAIAGQTTPKGFPGFTKNPDRKKPQNYPIYAVVNKKRRKRRIPVGGETSRAMERDMVEARKRKQANAIAAQRFVEVHKVQYYEIKRGKTR